MLRVRKPMHDEFFAGAALAAGAVSAGCASAPKGSAIVAVPALVAFAAAKDSPVTMANLDDFLGRRDVAAIDLRDFEERFNGGYVAGTETIPFFQHLEGRMVTRGAVDDVLDCARESAVRPYS